MMLQARIRAVRAALDNASFIHGDAPFHAFAEVSFDVALSRTGDMFFSDQLVAFTNIARALHPDARLALVSWRTAAENEWITALA
jgi:ubiquinone/menaquinone biosynthesis C-methylase UbiE